MVRSLGNPFIFQLCVAPGLRAGAAVPVPVGAGERTRRRKALRALEPMLRGLILFITADALHSSALILTFSISSFERSALCCIDADRSDQIPAPDEIYKVHV